jgi:NADP-reducing hydrogenase subunit HndB
MTQKVKTPQDLLALRQKAKESLELRSGPKEITITVHMGTCGIAAGGREVLAKLAELIEAGGIKNTTLRQAGCAGLCDREPMLTLTDAAGKEYRYGKLTADKLDAIVTQHVKGGSPVMDYLIEH